MTVRATISYQGFWRGLALASMLAAPLAGYAQVYPAVRGHVTTKAGVAVEFATVTLHRAADSVVVKTEFSDTRGDFQLAAPAGKSYRVSVAQLGFGRYWSAPFELPAAGLALPAVVLASQATALKEVTVAGRKPLFERQADRTVMHVADSPLGAGATTLDVLARSPGVSLSASNELSLRGRQGLLIVIDGKRKYEPKDPFAKSFAEGSKNRVAILRANKEVSESIA